MGDFVKMDFYILVSVIQGKILNGTYQRIKFNDELCGAALYVSTNEKLGFLVYQASLLALVNFSTTDSER